MLHHDIVEKLAQELKIAPLNIIRENLELETLDALSHSKLVDGLIFYGGTALRLAYNSFRFSEDLDFLLVKDQGNNQAELEKALKEVVQNNQGVSLEEAIDKKNTLFGLLHITHPLLKHPIRIKVEICKKKNGIKKENKLITSSTTNLEVIFPVADIDSIYKTKLAATKNRHLARDWFDLWYLNSKLNRDIDIKIKKLFNFNKKEFTDGLKRWLPRDKWKIIETVFNYYLHE